jgi:hypothetical protein
MNLTRPLTITHRDPAAGADEYGNPIPGSTGSTTTVGFLDQQSVPGQNPEILVGQTTVQIDALLILPPGTDINADDWITMAGSTFEVIGTPARKTRINGIEHHVEARLRQVAG